MLLAKCGKFEMVKTLTMVLAGKKAKRHFSVNHSAKKQFINISKYSYIFSMKFLAYSILHNSLM